MLQGEDLAGNHPRQRAPGGREKEDVNAHESNGCLLRSEVEYEDVAVAVLARRSCAKDRDKKLADTHSNPTEEKERAAAPGISCIKTGDGGHNVDAGGDESDGKSVGDAGVEEVLSAVVKDEIDSWARGSVKHRKASCGILTSQLLQRLNAHACQLPLQHAAAETIEIAGLANAHLELVACLDLGKLIPDGIVVVRQPADATKSGLGLVHLPALDEIAGSLWEQKHANHKDNGPGKLDSDGDTVRARVIAKVCGIVNDSSEE
jgi:hypothetical protein